MQPDCGLLAESPANPLLRRVLARSLVRAHPARLFQPVTDESRTTGIFFVENEKIRKSPRLAIPASDGVGLWCLESSLSDYRFFNLMGTSTKTPVMGEPEPLDLELLQRGNDDEIRRAIHELELFSYAQTVV